MKRIIITGANGVGKSRVAQRLANTRPEVPLVSFDAIKLQTDWQQKPRLEIDALLAHEIAKDAWILEGGPSLLSQAIERADALIWLDPPEYIRAWRLLTRPLKSIGKTRSEIPVGNVDWPIQQYRFALRSLKNKSYFHTHISKVFEGFNSEEKWHCRDERCLTSAINHWAAGSEK